MITYRPFFLLIGFTLLCITPLVFPAQDSTSLPKKTTITQPAGSVNDEELILDEPAAAIIPEQKKPASPPPQAVPAEKPAVTAPAAVNKATDSATGKPVSTKATVPPPSQAAKPAVPKKDTVKTVVDEELILEGGAEDLLGQEKPAQVKKVIGTDSAALSRTPDSAKAVQAPSDTSSAQPGPGGSSGRQRTVAALQIPAAPATKIEKVRSINFGANLKEYRSPKLAMLMSLILPGSGQIYAKSNLIAVGFLALEAAVFGTGYAFIAKGKNQKKKAHAYADSLYDVSKYEKYSADLRTYLNTSFGDPAKADSIILESIFFSDPTLDQGFLENAQRKNDDYYDALDDSLSIYVRGWKDVQPEFTENGFTSDSAQYQGLTGDSIYFVSHTGQNDFAYGFSANQLHYIDLIDQSQSSARIGRNVYLSLLVNHLASAVIAGIVAKKHNDALLGVESFWRHIDVEQQLVNTGSHSVNGYALGVSF